MIVSLKFTLGPSADPELTPLGENQAVAVHEAWKSELKFGLPIPGRLYCSPLTRALRTCEITFDGILPDDKHPIILEVNIHPSALFTIYHNHATELSRI